jgi:hypothetical protein
MEQTKKIELKDLKKKFRTLQQTRSVLKDKGKNSSLKLLFPIKSDFDPTEAYSEMWARIMNCAITGFNALEKKENVDEFIKNTDFCLGVERIFSLYQTIKILRFMGINYSDIHTIKKGNNSDFLRTQLYRENTHVFAYYILTSI